MSLARIVELSVRRRGVVLAIWAAVFAAALASIPRLSIDAVPDVTNTQVAILTSAPGLSPLEVEQYLTYPVEMAMNGIPGLDEIRSISRTAVSAVTVIFKDGTDGWLARQMVSERMAIAEADIPPGYGHPELGPVSTGLGEIYEFYLVSKKHTPMELRTMLDWDVSIKLRSVPGVVEVNGMGGEAKQYQVVLDPKRLAGYRLSLSDVQSILERNNAAMGGGYIEKNGESFSIRADAQFHSIEEIENTVVTSDADGTPVLIKNLGTVRIGAALRFGAATKYGEGEIVKGTVMMLTGANSRDVVRGVKDKLAEIQRELPAGVRDPLLLRPRRVHRPHAQDRRHQPGGGGAPGGGGPLLHAGELPRRADRRAGHSAGHGDRAHRHGPAGDHREPDVAGGDRLRPPGRRGDRDAGGGADRDRGPAGPEPRGRLLPGGPGDGKGGAPGRLLAAHHPARLSAAHGARGGGGADVQADGGHRRARARRRAAVFADRVPGARRHGARPGEGARQVRRPVRPGAAPLRAAARSAVAAPEAGAGGGGDGAHRDGPGGHDAGRGVRSPARRGGAVARRQTAPLDLDHRGPAPGPAGRGRARPHSGGQIDRHPDGALGGGDRSGWARRDRR